MNNTYLAGHSDVTGISNLSHAPDLVMCLDGMAELKSREDWQALLDSVDTVLFDCDGMRCACLHAKAASLTS